MAMLATLLLVGATLARNWVDRSQVNGAQASFNTAVLQAKVLALRNQKNQLLTTTAVGVCLNGSLSSLQIVQTDANPNNICDTSGNTLVRTLPIAQGISIKQGVNVFSCLAFNAAGMVILPAGSSCTNDTATAFTIGKNNESFAVNIL